MLAPVRVSEMARQGLAEFLGTGLLVAAVVGSGIAAQRLSPGDAGLQLLENALVTGAVLVALILALGPVSAAFNPMVTLAERVFGAITTRQAAVFVAAQVAGGAAGAMLANLMFALPAVTVSGRIRSGGGLWLAEAVATFGLLLVIFGVVRSGRNTQVAYAVGGYITAAYWFTSSTSFANPAVTLARTLSDTFAGIAPASSPMFLLMQLVGAGFAVAVIRLLYPQASALAADLTQLANTTRRRATDSGQLTGAVAMTERPTVLYACVHNSGRSVVAKVLTEHYAGGRVDVRSAGSEPASAVNPVVAQVLAERGLSTAAEIPTKLELATVEDADVVITMGCGEACPYVPGKRYEDWPVDDPAGQDIETVRRIVDDVDNRVRTLLNELRAG